MTTPVGPKGFPLSRAWWLSGSAWHVKTAQDVWAVLEVGEADRATRASAVRRYYDHHPVRLVFVPDELLSELGLP